MSLCKKRDKNAHKTTWNPDTAYRNGSFCRVWEGDITTNFSVAHGYATNGFQKDNKTLNHRHNKNRSQPRQTRLASDETAGVVYVAVTT
jgi:hypothetical protein